MKFGKSEAWSIGIGVVLPIRGYIDAGLPTDVADFLSLVIAILFWTLVVRAIIYMWQKLTRRPN